MRRALIILLALVTACDSTMVDPATIPPAHRRAVAPVDQNAVLDEVERRTFQWFWDTADPATRLVPDRWPNVTFSSIAAVGFGLTAYGIGAERGYVSREDAADRVLKTLQFFLNAPTGPEAAGRTGYKGFYYHFLSMNSGARFKDVELSTIDTTLLLSGALFCQSYFDRDNATERAIRDGAEELYRRADWTFFLARPPLISMGWTPERGLHNYDWHGYNEAMILVILALGSPTHPVDPSAWTAYQSTFNWGTFYGQPHVMFAPLFGHHYSHVWIDFRGIQDPYMRSHGIDYAENTRRATIAQRSYAIANPQGYRDYGPTIWGLSACDGPIDATLTVDGRQRKFYTYAARGADGGDIRDDGTITPTAAISSMPFTPDISMEAMLAMRERYGDHLYTRYGFLDAFNPTLNDPSVKPQAGTIDPQLGWFDTDYLGIDQGPIIAMIENYRSGLVWNVMKKNPHIRTGLQRAGFSGGWLDQ